MLLGGDGLPGGDHGLLVRLQACLLLADLFAHVRQGRLELSELLGPVLEQLLDRQQLLLDLTGQRSGLGLLHDQPRFQGCRTVGGGPQSLEVDLIGADDLAQRCGPEADVGGIARSDDDRELQRRTHLVQPARMIGDGAAQDGDLRVEFGELVQGGLPCGLDRLQGDDGLVVALDGEAQLSLDLLQADLGRGLLVAEPALLCVQRAELRATLGCLLLQLP
ncbi:MAG: hypothetical protein EA387_12055 [Nitriliruptor sp.]|nr:MAG: hypothetical protein EA387_12055 [Nitriliruptor sp.]